MFTDGSKSEQGVGAGIAIFKSGNFIQVKQKMHQKPSRATGDLKSIRIYRKHRNRRQDSHLIH